MSFGTNQAVGERLQEILHEAGQEPLYPQIADRFAEYLALLLRWNARMNLTAIRDQEGILSRHFAESIACARALPRRVATVLDFGSGAGFPGIPIALCRPEIVVTLAESQGKKAAFLREAVRTLGLRINIYEGRAELMSDRFECVTLRAVDRMNESMASAAGLIKENGWLVLLTTAEELENLSQFAKTLLDWEPPIAIEGSEQRIIAMGQRRQR